MATTYEFIVEILASPDLGDDPDIIDTLPFDTLAAASAYVADVSEPWRLALRRDTGNEDEGLTERYYAYPDRSTGRLTGCFETATGYTDGPDVPKRFAQLAFPIW